MANLRFRLTNIALDEEEDVATVTAVVRHDAYAIITKLIGPVETTARERGGTEMTIKLPIDDASALFRACDKMSGEDPEPLKSSHEIYHSLALIFLGLMGE